MFAVLPQFVVPVAGPVWLQLLVLGSIQKRAGMVSWVQSRWHQGRLETALNTRAISNGRNGVQALSSA